MDKPTNEGVALPLALNSTNEAPTGRILIFFHVMALNHVLAIIDTEVTALYYSGLYDRVDAIYVFLAWTPEQPSKRKQVRTFFARQGAKFQIVTESSNSTRFERLTLEAMPAMINDDDRVFYMHSKGVSRVDVDEREKRRLATAKMLFWVVGRHDLCLEALRTHDTVGVQYRAQPAPHWSGNFWWATGYHIRRLHLPIGKMYLDPEMWVGSGAKMGMLAEESTLYPTVYVDLPKTEAVTM